MGAYSYYASGSTGSCYVVSYPASISGSWDSVDVDFKGNIIVSSGEFNNKKEEKEPMKNLYNVIVVTKNEKIILDSKTVAENEDEAKFNVGVFETLKEKNLKPKDVTVICNALGQVKIEKEVQKVQLVKE